MSSGCGDVGPVIQTDPLQTFEWWADDNPGMGAMDVDAAKVVEGTVMKR